MSQNNLKKEFSKSSVQRMRNIITGKTGDKTRIQSGYELQESDHHEGDIWEESGKTWTIKNGIKQTITKLDRIKKLAVLPILCPNCEKPMKITDANKKMYSLHGMCLNCVVSMETKIKIEGRWQEYESKMMNSNKNASLEDFERAVEEWMKEKDTYVTEAGHVEDWSKADKSKIYQKIRENIDKLKKTEI